MNGIDNAIERPAPWADLVGQSYALYGEKFWTLFRIALLPALLPFLWRYIYRLIIREMAVAGWIDFSPGKFALLAALGWVDGAFYWIVSSFFFAAIATTVLGMADEARPAISDAFTRARARIGTLTAVALLCWTIFWLGRTAATFAVQSALDRLGLRPSLYAWIVILSVLYLMLAGLLARLALAVPALMDKSAVSLKEALRISMKKTEGWEFFFMMFLAKSAILGFALVWLGNHGLDWLWQRGVLTQTTYPWVSQTFYICVAAALESPLFIAFSILYRNSNSS